VYLPRHWEFKEPTRLTNQEVTKVLEFWRDRQVTDLEDVLTFHKWRDMDGGLQDPVSDCEDPVARMISAAKPPVTTMSNSGPYPVTPAHRSSVAQLRSLSHLLRSQSRSYTSVKHDTWSIPHSLFTTPRRLPCSFVSSPCSRYILHLVSFSPDLVYFTRT